MLRRSTRPVGAAAARRAAAALLHLRLGFTEYICSVSLTYTHALLTPLHAAAVATHTATPLLLNMHTYISRRDKRRSTPPATTGIDLVAGALLPLVVYELTGLQRGGTPSKPAGFGAAKRSREVKNPPRGLRR